MNRNWIENMIWFFFFELQNLIFYLFYKHELIQFRYVFYYVVLCHCLLALIYFLKRVSQKYRGFIADLLYGLLISCNLFVYGISFGNIGARNINTVAYVVNNLYFYCLVLLCFIVFKGIKGIWASGILVLVFGILNYHIYHFRGNVLNLLDIYSLKTAWNVKDNYGILINEETVLFVFGIICSMVLFSSKCVKLKWGGSIHFCWGLIPIMVVSLWIVHSSSFLNMFQLGAIYYEAGNNNGYYYNTILKYLEERQAMKSVPEGYDVTSLAAEFDQYDLQNLSLPDTMPNVIVIMNESFADFSVINDKVEFSQNITENLTWIREEAVWGNVYVSVFGGNTANSEYEFLTNDSMMYYPVGSVPYSVYINGQIEALPEYFNQLGYYTCAVHPYKSSGWNRPSVYGYMNFQKKIFEEAFEDSERIREYVSDSGDYEKVLELLREQEKPVFCFNITMQNHGGYEDDEKFDEKISVKGLESEKIPQAETYLALAKESDRAIGDFLLQLKDFDEPTIVVFFGDHQPGVEDAFYDYLYGENSTDLSLDDKIKQYTTPFFIWSNEGLQESKVDRISLNYLSALLLKEANLPLTKYQSFLMEELYPEYPVITSVGIIDKSGNVKLREDINSQLLDKYEQIIYNHIIDRNNTLKGVFSVDIAGGLP